MWLFGNLGGFECLILILPAQALSSTVLMFYGLMIWVVCFDFGDLRVRVVVFGLL